MQSTGNRWSAWHSGGSALHKAVAFSVMGHSRVFLCFKVNAVQTLPSQKGMGMLVELIWQQQFKSCPSLAEPGTADTHPSTAVPTWPGLPPSVPFRGEGVWHLVWWLRPLGPPSGATSQRDYLLPEGTFDTFFLSRYKTLNPGPLH